MSDSQEVSSCQLIGIVGIIIQLVLGALSFSVLIYKRYQEKPKRPWKIWAMDTSKQGTSQMMAHIVNVIISMQLSNKLEGDACIWYFTTNILDNTIGVLICICVLRLLENTLMKGRFERFKSGNYYTEVDSYDEERSTPMNQNQASLQISKMKKQYIISHSDWVVQFLIWNSIVIISKSVLFEVEVLLNEPLTHISMFLIGWIQPYETLELILVIIIVPVIMNGLAFWIQDNFLKKQTPQGPLPNVLLPKPQRATEETSTVQEHSGYQQPLL